MHTTSDCESARKSLTTVGAAHHALRAYVFAVNNRADDGVVYRYAMTADLQSAAIVSGDGEMLAEAPLQTWAQEGRRIRSALIGLKFVRERIEQAHSGGDFQPAHFSLDALAGTAAITIAGETLDRDLMISRAHDWWLSKNALAILDGIASEDLQTIDGWAELGRQLEIDFFIALEGAEQYELTTSALSERERGRRLGIISRPNKPAASKAAVA